MTAARGDGQQGSGLARTALRVALFNATANALLLVGNTYAARCLGAVNVGIGAQVQVGVQQAALAFNGGLEMTSVRAIASGQESAATVARAVLAFRLAVAVPLALAWMAWALATQEPGVVRTAWLLGGPLLVIAAVQLPFVFQATERMPRWSALTAMSALLVAGAYALFFRPGMPAGSDLWVLVAVGTVMAAVSVTQAFAGVHAAAPAPGMRWRDTGAVAVRLIAQSWRYWLLALLIFVYTALPVLLVARMQGDAAAGVLRVCLQLASGLELVFASINGLLLPRLVRAREEGEHVLRAQQRSYLRTHIALAVGALVVAALAAPFVFDRFLGPQFQEGTAPFVVLALSRAVVFVGQLAVWGVIALRLDGVLLAATACGALTSLALNLALIPGHSLLGAAWASVAAEAVIVSLCWLGQRRYRVVPA
ncbi:lipopolysaccharide biosynthesis protein [Ramlibacter sp. PS4R-6]|uniref:lipopolysaccharide biosynthesis protein n=1 Tax=Ramlibacter sp. PS4R-6 TaxID=3133438 RepID=UPI00309A354D